MNIRFFAPLVLILFCSCARQVSITSNSFADIQEIPYGFPDGCSFFILAAQNDNQMLSKEIAYKIEKIIEDKGYIISDAENADYYLIFTFGMTHSKATINTPKYIPGRTQTTTGSVYGCGGYAGYQEQTQTSGSVIYMPEEYIFFHRMLQINVYNAEQYRNTKQESQIWQGSACSTGESSDLRNIMDYLLITAFKHFGENTKKDVHTEMSSDNKEIKRFRNTIGLYSSCKK